MLLPIITSRTAASAVKGGATIISTPLASATDAFNAVVSATASEIVLFSFQLPAMIGVRILSNYGLLGIVVYGLGNPSPARFTMVSG